MTQQQESIKTLSIGPPKGQITNLISKVSAINAKHGPFHALLVLGDFFSSSDSLNAEEADLLDGNKATLPIRTYIYQAKQRPPPRVRNLIASLEKGKRRKDSVDQKPLKIADNLFWLGKDQVNWIPRSGPVDDSDGHQVVDDQAETIGLRVAVCGGVWNPEKWAQEVRGKVNGEAQDEEQETSDDGEAYILPSHLERLYRHPAFKPPAPPSAPSSAVAEAQSLAAARAQMKAEQQQQQQQQALTTGSSNHQQPAIDIVLLPTWPSGVSLFSNNFPPAAVPDEARTWGLPPLAEVMRRARPRYAFAIAPDSSTAPGATNPEWTNTGVFWEREPYSTSTTAVAPTSASGSNATPVARTNRVTRFISLAKFANAKKVRWFLALNLPVGPGAADASAAAAVKGATQSPFGEFHSVPATKRKAGDGGKDAGLGSEVNFRWQQGGRQGKKPRTEGDAPRDDGPPPEGYVCKICGSAEHYIRLCPHKGAGSGAAPNGLPNRPEGAEEALGPRTRREPVQMVGPQDCWFCLSNTGCAKHLVVAIGEESYLALPKGQLPPASSEASPVPGGGHVLLIPVTHTNRIGSKNTKLSNEMEEYLQALAKCYSAHGCILVAWSIVKHSNTRAGHLQIQAVPVPEERILMAGNPHTFEDAIRAEATQRGYELEEILDPDQRRLGANDDEHREYFELHILNPIAKRTRITYRLDLAQRAVRFDYQFARTVLAGYLGVPDRADWRRCAKSEKVEEVETRSFRECFREWMPEFGEEDSDEGEA